MIRRRSLFLGAGLFTLLWLLGSAVLRSHDFRSPEWALLSAAYGGDTARVQELLDGGAPIECLNRRDWVQSPWDLGTPLILAAREGHLTTIRLLLQRGANVNARPAGFSALFQTLHARRRDWKAVALLLIDAGANVNVPYDLGSGPWRVPVLTLAVDAGNVRLVRALLETGADPNPRVTPSTSPIQVARKKGQPEIVSLLKKHGARDQPGKP